MEDNPDRHTVQLATKFRTEQLVIYAVKWTVPKFPELMKTDAIVGGIRSSSYSVVKVPDSEFQLKLFFDGRTKHSMKVFYLSTTSIFLKWYLSVNMRYNDPETFTGDFRKIKANEWQCCALVEDVATFSRKSCTLSISWEFHISQDVKVCHNTLCDDFGNLLTDDSYSDVTMKSAEGVEFRSHKTVLAIRSKVLKAHFEHHSKESLTNLVETTWETEVLRDLLTFVYTNKAPQVDDHPEKLLAAADYYNLEGLKSLCEEVILKRLSVDNAIDTIQLAELHSMQSLKESVLKFIRDGQGKMLTKTQGWASCQSTELIKTIFEFFVAEEMDTSDILTVALNEL